MWLEVALARMEWAPDELDQLDYELTHRFSVMVRIFRNYLDFVSGYTHKQGTLALLLADGWQAAIPVSDAWGVAAIT